MTGQLRDPQFVSSDAGDAMGVAVCQRGRTVVWPRSCGVNYRCCHRRRPCPPQGQRAAVFGAIAAVSGALAVTVLLMFTAFCYCSPSSSKTWKGCADGLHDEDTLQALQRGKFIDDPNVFDLSRFDNKIIGLCLCRFDFCPDALTLLSTEQRSIRQFWHASRWGDEALGFISVIDVCHFVPQAFWRQNIGQQVRTSFFWQLTHQSSDRLCAVADSTTGISVGEYLQRWAGQHNLSNDHRTVTFVFTTQTKHSNNNDINNNRA